MTDDAIPDELRRFLLTCGWSVPHVEALLLLRREAPASWDPARLGARLYVGEKRAAQLLAELGDMGVAAELDDQSYRYAPASPELAAMLDVLADTYARQLVAVTHLIHHDADAKAKQFAAAFRFRKE
jgi:hypothetical protein